MSTTSPIAPLFDRYVTTFGSGDLDAIVALHAADTQFRLHTGREPARGRDAVREAFRGFFQQWPSFGFETYGVLTGADHWVLDWAMTATPLARNGQPKTVRFDCLDVVTVSDHGLVLRKDTFVDMSQVQRAMQTLTT